MAPESHPARRWPWHHLLLLGTGVAAGGALLALAYWTWQTRGLESTEMLFWESRSRMALAVPPPVGAMLTSPPLMLYTAMATGSAHAAALVIGLLAVATVLLLGRHERIWLWTLPVLVHPVVVLGTVAHPSSLLAALLLALATTGLVEYGRSRQLVWLTGGALALGLVVLAQWSAWPSWIVVAAALALAGRRSWAERGTVCLVALVPAGFLSAAWLYFNWAETGLPLYFLQVPGVSLPRPELIAAGIIGHGSAGVPWGVWLLTLAPPLLLLAFISSRTRSHADTEPALPGWALALLLFTPAAILASDAIAGRTGSTTALLAPGFAMLVAVGRMTARGRRAPVVALVLIASVTGAWFAVGQGDRETRTLMAAATSPGVDGLPSAPFIMLAREIATRRGPSDRVLFDDGRLFGLTATLPPGTWITSSSYEYGLALQQPERWARFIVGVERQPGVVDFQGIDERSASRYRLVATTGALRLFDLSPQSSTP